jgi:hypothetical protein
MEEEVLQDAQSQLKGPRESPSESHLLFKKD